MILNDSHVLHFTDEDAERTSCLQSSPSLTQQEKICSQIMDAINSLLTNLKCRVSTFYGVPFCTTVYFPPS